MIKIYMFRPLLAIIRCVIQVCHTIFRFVVPYSGLSYHTQVCRTIFRFVIPYSGLSYHIQVCHTIFRFVIPYSGLSYHIQVCRTIFRFVIAYSGLSYHIQVCRTIFRFVVPYSIRRVSVYWIWYIAMLYTIFNSRHSMMGSQRQHAATCLIKTLLQHTFLSDDKPDDGQ